METNRKLILNLPEIIKDQSFLAITRMLATTLMNESYIVVGDYIQGLSDGDLKILLEEQDRTDTHAYDNLMMMSEMLAIGEGCDGSTTVSDFKDRLEQFIVYLIMESLKRKGLVRVFYENMSFHHDTYDKRVAEKI